MSGFHTLSGKTLSPCEVYLLVIATAAKVGEKIADNLTPQQMSAFLLELESLFAIVLTGPELLTILGVVALIAAAGAFFC